MSTKCSHNHPVIIIILSALPHRTQRNDLLLYISNIYAVYFAAKIMCVCILFITIIRYAFRNSVKIRAVVQVPTRMGRRRNLWLKPKEKENADKPIMPEKGTYTLYLFTPPTRINPNANRKTTRCNWFVMGWSNYCWDGKTLPNWLYYSCFGYRIAKSRENRWPAISTEWLLNMFVCT